MLLFKTSWHVVPRHDRYLQEHSVIVSIMTIVGALRMEHEAYFASLVDENIKAPQIKLLVSFIYGEVVGTVRGREFHSISESPVSTTGDTFVNRGSQTTPHT